MTETITLTANSYSSQLPPITITETIYPTASNGDNKFVTKTETVTQGPNSDHVPLYTASKVSFANNITQKVPSLSKTDIIDWSSVATSLSVDQGPGHLTSGLRSVTPHAWSSSYSAGDSSTSSHVNQLPQPSLRSTSSAVSNDGSSAGVLTGFGTASCITVAEYTTVTQTITDPLSDIISTGVIATTVSQTMSRSDLPQAPVVTQTLPCFNSECNLPPVYLGKTTSLWAILSIHTETTLQQCTSRCLSHSLCLAMSHGQQECKLFKSSLSALVFVAAEINERKAGFYDRCPGMQASVTCPTVTSTLGARPTGLAKRHNVVDGLLGSVLAPLTSALPVSDAVAFLDPLLSDLNPIADPVTSALAPAIEPVTSALIPVVSNVASLLSPVISGVAPLLSPVASIVDGVLNEATPLVSVLNPAASGVISALLPAITPIPSILEPAASLAGSILSPVLSGIDTLATNALVPLESGVLSPVLSDILLPITPVLSGLRPIETGLLKPAGSLLSDAIGLITSVVYPVATPAISGILGAATSVLLPVIEPVVCDLLASEVESGILGLNAGCNQAGAATSGATARKTASEVAFSVSGSVTNAVRSSVGDRSSASLLRTASSPSILASASRCTITTTSCETMTVYVNLEGRMISAASRSILTKVNQTKTTQPSQQTSTDMRSVVYSLTPAPVVAVTIFVSI